MPQSCQSDEQHTGDSNSYNTRHNHVAMVPLIHSTYVNVFQREHAKIMS